MNLRSLTWLVLVLSSNWAHSEIFFDVEKDLIPYVEIRVVLPQGFEVLKASEAGLANLIPDILEAGTASKTRLELGEALAGFGAALNFSVANQYSFWTLEFPWVADRDYSKLAELLSENWNQARWTEEAFSGARIKLESALKASLDSDNSLASSSARRWLNLKVLGGFPVFMESLPGLKLEKVRSHFEKNFLGVTNVWAGLVAPESSLDFAKTLLKRVFARQGAISEGAHLTFLPPAVSRPQVKQNKRQAFIIDKKDRNQSVTALLALASKPYSQLSLSDEQAFSFGTWVYFENGLSSLFAEELRGKRGLAYSVGSAGSQYSLRPMLSVALNPLRAKQQEAYVALRELTRAGLESNELLLRLSEKQWAQQWTSFKYAHVLERSTPSGRLGERMGVVTGSLSAAMYSSSMDSWKLTPPLVGAVMQRLWLDSSIVLVGVGDSKELDPLIKSSFKQFSRKIIPYQKALQRSSFE